MAGAIKCQAHKFISRTLFSRFQGRRVMGKYQIEIAELYDAPVEPVFSLLTVHETFGKGIRAKIEGMKDSQV